MNLSHLLATYGYWAVFALVAAESLSIPLPGETALILAAAYARRTHHLSGWITFAVASAAAVTGDNIGYWIGHQGGYQLARKHGHRIRLDERKLKTARYLFDAHGPKVVFFGRFVSALRTYPAFLAGASKMAWRKFLPANAFGGLAWAGACTLAAYLAGTALQQASAAIGWALLGTGVAATLAAALLLRRHAGTLADRAKAACPGPLEPATPHRDDTRPPGHATATPSCPRRGCDAAHRRPCHPTGCPAGLRRPAAAHRFLVAGRPSDCRGRAWAPARDVPPVQAGRMASQGHCGRLWPTGQTPGQHRRPGRGCARRPGRGQDPRPGADDRQPAPRDGAPRGADRVRRPRPGRHLYPGHRAPGRDQPALPVPALPGQKGAVSGGGPAVLPADGGGVRRGGRRAGGPGRAPGHRQRLRAAVPAADAAAAAGARLRRPHRSRDPGPPPRPRSGT